MRLTRALGFAKTQVSEIHLALRETEKALLTVTCIFRNSHLDPVGLVAKLGFFEELKIGLEEEVVKHAKRLGQEVLDIRVSEVISALKEEKKLAFKTLSNTLQKQTEALKRLFRNPKLPLLRDWLKQIKPCLEVLEDSERILIDHPLISLIEIQDIKSAFVKAVHNAQQSISRILFTRVMKLALNSFQNLWGTDRIILIPICRQFKKSAQDLRTLVKSLEDEELKIPNDSKIATQILTEAKAMERVGTEGTLTAFADWIRVTMDTCLPSGVFNIKKSARDKIRNVWALFQSYQTEFLGDNKEKLHLILWSTDLKTAISIAQNLRFEPKTMTARFFRLFDRIAEEAKKNLKDLKKCSGGLKHAVNKEVFQRGLAIAHRHTILVSKISETRQFETVLKWVSLVENDMIRGKEYLSKQAPIEAQRAFILSSGLKYKLLHKAKKIFLRIVLKESLRQILQLAKRFGMEKYSTSLLSPVFDVFGRMSKQMEYLETTMKSVMNSELDGILHPERVSQVGEINGRILAIIQNQLVAVRGVANVDSLPAIIEWFGSLPELSERFLDVKIKMSNVAELVWEEMEELQQNVLATVQTSLKAAVMKRGVKLLVVLAKRLHLDPRTHLSRFFSIFTKCAQKAIAMRTKVQAVLVEMKGLPAAESILRLIVQRLDSQISALTHVTEEQNLAALATWITKSAVDFSELEIYLPKSLHDNVEEIWVIYRKLDEEFSTAIKTELSIYVTKEAVTFLISSVKKIGLNLEKCLNHLFLQFPTIVEDVEHGRERIKRTLDEFKEDSSELKEYSSEISRKIRSDILHRFDIHLNHLRRIAERKDVDSILDWMEQVGRAAVEIDFKGLVGSQANIMNKVQAEWDKMMEQVLCTLQREFKNALAIRALSTFLKNSQRLNLDPSTHLRPFFSAFGMAANTVNEISLSVSYMKTEAEKGIKEEKKKEIREIYKPTIKRLHAHRDALHHVEKEKTIMAAYEWLSGAVNDFQRNKTDMTTASKTILEQIDHFQEDFLEKFKTEVQNAVKRAGVKMLRRLVAQAKRFGLARKITSRCTRLFSQAARIAVGTIKRIKDEFQQLMISLGERVDTKKEREICEKILKRVDNQVIILEEVVTSNNILIPVENWLQQVEKTYKDIDLYHAPSAYMIMEKIDEAQQKLFERIQGEVRHLIIEKGVGLMSNILKRGKAFGIMSMRVTSNSTQLLTEFQPVALDAVKQLRRELQEFEIMAEQSFGKDLMKRIGSVTCIVYGHLNEIEKVLRSNDLIQTAETFINVSIKMRKGFKVKLEKLGSTNYAEAEEIKTNVENFQEKILKKLKAETQSLVLREGVGFLKRLLERAKAMSLIRQCTGVLSRVVEQTKRKMLELKEEVSELFSESQSIGMSEKDVQIILKFIGNNTQSLQQILDEGDVDFVKLLDWVEEIIDEVRKYDLPGLEEIKAQIESLQEEMLVNIVQDIQKAVLTKLAAVVGTLIEKMKEHSRIFNTDVSWLKEIHIHIQPFIRELQEILEKERPDILGIVVEEFKDDISYLPVAVQDSLIKKVEGYPLKDFRPKTIKLWSSKLKEWAERSAAECKGVVNLGDFELMCNSLRFIQISTTTLQKAVADPDQFVESLVTWIAQIDFRALNHIPSSSQVNAILYEIQTKLEKLLTDKFKLFTASVVAKTGGKFLGVLGSHFNFPMLFGDKEAKICVECMIWCCRECRNQREELEDREYKNQDNVALSINPKGEKILRKLKLDRGLMRDMVTQHFVQYFVAIKKLLERINSTADCESSEAERIATCAYMVVQPLVSGSRIERFFRRNNLYIRDPPISAGELRFIVQEVTFHTLQDPAVAQEEECLRATWVVYAVIRKVAHWLYKCKDIQAPGPIHSRENPPSKKREKKKDQRGYETLITSPTSPVWAGEEDTGMGVSERRGVVAATLAFLRIYNPKVSPSDSKPDPNSSGGDEKVFESEHPKNKPAKMIANFVGESNNIEDEAKCLLRPANVRDCELVGVARRHGWGLLGPTCIELYEKIEADNIFGKVGRKEKIGLDDADRAQRGQLITPYIRIHKEGSKHEDEIPPLEQDMADSKASEDTSQSPRLICRITNDNNIERFLDTKVLFLDFVQILHRRYFTKRNIRVHDLSGYSLLFTYKGEANICNDDELDLDYLDFIIRDEKESRPYFILTLTCGVLLRAFGEGSEVDVSSIQGWMSKLSQGKDMIKEKLEELNATYFIAVVPFILLLIALVPLIAPAILLAEVYISDDVHIALKPLVGTVVLFLSYGPLINVLIYFSFREGSSFTEVECWGPMLIEFGIFMMVLRRLRILRGVIKSTEDQILRTDNLTYNLGMFHSGENIFEFIEDIDYKYNYSQVRHTLLNAMDLFMDQTRDKYDAAKQDQSCFNCFCSRETQYIGIPIYITVVFGCSPGIVRILLGEDFLGLPSDSQHVAYAILFNVVYWSYTFIGLGTLTAMIQSWFRGIPLAMIRYHTISGLTNKSVCLQTGLPFYIPPDTPERLHAWTLIREMLFYETTAELESGFPMNMFIGPLAVASYLLAIVMLVRVIYNQDSFDFDIIVGLIILFHFSIWLIMVLLYAAIVNYITNEQTAKAFAALKYKTTTKLWSKSEELTKHAKRFRKKARKLDAVNKYMQYYAQKSEDVEKMSSLEMMFDATIRRFETDTQLYTKVLGVPVTFTLLATLCSALISIFTAVVSIVGQRG